MSENRKNRRRAKWIFFISGWTLVLAVLFSFIAHLLLDRVGSLFASILILLTVVLLGVFFDLVGTAAAAADIAPLNAKAARRVAGARQGVTLVKNAEQVANFCNDVAGDISGIVSGTLIAGIVLKLIAAAPLGHAEFSLGIMLTALVAAMTVGGKAWGKIVAINKPTEVMLLVGLAICKLERPFKFLAGSGKNAEG